MKIDFPAPRHIHQQRKLWQDAFGDTDAFLDSFFRTAYDPRNCRCVLLEDQIAAILYWIDCEQKGQKLAYIYAVVTRPDCRGRGLCRMLMEDTHGLLAARGYAGVLLVPQEESLRAMYAGMGYQDAGGLSGFSCSAGPEPIPLQAVGADEFAALRRKLLPAGSVIQEGAGLSFLAEQLQFYSGENVLLAVYQENGILHGVEYLGNRAAAPGIIKALGASAGQFRTPGAEHPFAMFHGLTEDAVCPEYFGFAFD